MSSNNKSHSHKSLDHRIFRSDTKLNPEEINKLLGIKSVLPVKQEEKAKERAYSNLTTMLQLAVITLGLTSIALVGSMYQLKIGPFYEHEAVASSGD